MKVSITPRKKPQEEDVGSIMDHFGVQKGGQEGEPERKEDKSEPIDTAALLQQMGALSERVAAAERANLTLLSQPVSGHQIPREGYKIEPVTLDGLPDPVSDPKGYTEGLAERIKGQVRAENNAEQAHNRAQGELQGRIQSLWEDFSTGHEVYAEDQEKVEFVAQKVVKRLQRRGLDPQKYMFGASELFFADVVKEYDHTFGKPGVKDDEDEEGAASKKKKAVEEDDDGRSGGLFGGIESAGAPNRTQQEKPGDMIQDILEIQRKSGFF